eukprot:2325627-Rhodomonas_salina.2
MRAGQRGRRLGHRRCVRPWSIGFELRSVVIRMSTPVCRQPNLNSDLCPHATMLTFHISTAICQDMRYILSCITSRDS